MEAAIPFLLVVNVDRAKESARCGRGNLCKWMSLLVQRTRPESVSLTKAMHHSKEMVLMAICLSLSM
jgi:hypothetical protein